MTPLVFLPPYSLDILVRLLVKHNIAPGAQHDFQLLLLAPSEEVRQHFVLLGEGDFIIFFLSTFIVNFHGGILGYLNHIKIVLPKYPYFSKKIPK